jgi:hypothetical protein
MSIWIPVFLRKFMRLKICGSNAASCIVVFPCLAEAHMMRFAVAVTAKYPVIVMSLLDHFPEKHSVSFTSSKTKPISLYPLICSSIGRFPILSPAGKGIFAFQNLASNPAIKYIPARVLAIIEVSMLFSETVVASTFRVLLSNSTLHPRLLRK